MKNKTNSRSNGTFGSHLLWMNAFEKQKKITKTHQRTKKATLQSQHHQHSWTDSYLSSFCFCHFLFFAVVHYCTITIPLPPFFSPFYPPLTFFFEFEQQFSPEKKCRMCEISGPKHGTASILFSKRRKRFSPRPSRPQRAGAGNYPPPPPGR